MQLNLWLQNEFLSRQKRNPRFSLRAFSRVLEMNPSTVSQLLSGKRKASSKLVNAICEKLVANPKEREALLTAVKRKKAVDTMPDYTQVSLDAFALISEWHHYAILELIAVESFNPEVTWIAKQLDISALEARAALERLVRLELIQKNESGYVRKNEFVTNGLEGMTGSAHKLLQKQILQKALDAIDNVPQEEKDITSITMAIDESKMVEAKKMIKEFRRKMCLTLEDGKRTRVYNLAIQLYPISKKKEKNDETF